MATPRWMPARARRERGFTLIELLVVVIVIGVLVAIAVLVFLRQRDKAINAALKADLRQASTVLHTHVLEGGTMPPACTDAAMCAPAGQVGAMLAGSPFDVKFSPNNRIGAYWYSPSNKTFHMCVEYAPGGVADRYTLIDTWGQQLLNDNSWSGTGVCPWTP